MIRLHQESPRFDLGSTFATINAVAAFASEVLVECLRRHASCDWGDLGEEETSANERALLTGGRLSSRYSLPDAGKLWVITEHDRSATTLLLPQDY